MDALPVSVVIPAHRCAEHIAGAVTSALAQQPPPTEVIVVDDGSGDDTAARARAAGADVITLERASGAHAARNAGIEHATQDWIALLDCDDLWLPGHLASVYGARDGHVLVGAAAVIFDGSRSTGRGMGWGGRPRVLRGPREVADPENKVVTSGALLRRDVVLSLGGFRPGLAEDLDLWLRMLERGTGIATGQPTVLYRRHAQQTTAGAAGRRPTWYAVEEVLDRFADRPWHTRALRARREGIVAWDEARAALANGAPRIGTLARLSLRLAHPLRAGGVVRMWIGRRRLRRLAARVPDDAVRAASDAARRTSRSAASSGAG